MIGAHLSSEEGFYYSDWLVFLEGEADIESFRSGKSLEGEIFDLYDKSLSCPIFISPTDSVQPKVGFEALSIEIDMPESMCPETKTARRLSSKSDVPASNKLFAVSSPDYSVGEISSRSEYLDFIDSVYTSFEDNFSRRDTYIDLVGYRDSTDQVKEIIEYNS